MKIIHNHENGGRECNSELLKEIVNSALGNDEVVIEVDFQ